MTPAEWLAFITLGSFVYGLIESIIDPNAIVSANNPVAAAIRLSFGVAAIAFALIVLL